MAKQSNMLSNCDLGNLTNALNINHCRGLKKFYRVVKILIVFFSKSQFGPYCTVLRRFGPSNRFSSRARQEGWRGRAGKGGRLKLFTFIFIILSNWFPFVIIYINFHMKKF